MPNGIDLGGMFKSGSRWSLIAWLLAVLGFVVSVFVTLISTIGGNTLWGLWFSIFWLNITVFVLALGVNNQLTAINLALRGVRDESDMSQEPWVRKIRDKEEKKNTTRTQGEAR